MFIDFDIPWMYGYGHLLYQKRTVGTWEGTIQ